MKNILIFFVATFFIICATFASENREFSGRILDINSSKRTIVVQGEDGEKINFSIVPSTVIEYYGSIFDDTSFRDLYVDGWVKIFYKKEKNNNISVVITIYDEIDRQIEFN